MTHPILHRPVDLAHARHRAHQQQAPEPDRPRARGGEDAPERHREGEHVQAMHAIAQQAEDGSRERVHQDERGVEPSALAINPKV